MDQCDHLYASVTSHVGNGVTTTCTAPTLCVAIEGEDLPLISLIK